VLSRSVETKRGDLHNVGFHNLYTSPNIATAMKSRIGRMCSMHTILLEDSKWKELLGRPGH